MKFGVGQPLKRQEDHRFLTGKGQFTADIYSQNEARAVFLRSTHAHAVIKSINTKQAASAPGVIAVFTADDITHLGGLPCPAAPMLNTEAPERPLLAKDRVRHAGEPVAMIVAETENLARDAAELIQIDYETLPAVSATDAALNSNAPILHQKRDSNLALEWELGSEKEYRSSARDARRITRLTLINQRVVANPIEPRAAVGSYNPKNKKFTLYAGTQGVHQMRNFIAGDILKIPPESLRVVTQDVGGGFGMKAFLFHEYPLVLFAAQKLQRHVKWIADRSESFLSDTQGRDHITKATLALAADGKILGVKVVTTANVGAYFSQFAPFIPTLAAAGMHAGVYDIPALYNKVQAVFTNTVPVDAYRGAGRPEASYVIERLIDAAARDLSIPPDEIRRRNFIPTQSIGKTKPPTLPIDSGNFSALMDDALKRADAKNFPKRQKAARAKGKRAGLGLSCYIERTGGPPNGYARMHINGKEKIAHVYPGTQSTGQGHETAWAQIASEKTGLLPEQIQVHSGDTDALSSGGGTGGSSSLYMSAGAISSAADSVVKIGRENAASLLQTKTDAIEFQKNEGQPVFVHKDTGQSFSLFDLAREAEQKAELNALDAEGVYAAEGQTYPNGCHVCEVEIDEATGALQIVRYCVADDFGKIVNPLLAAGQVQGGIVQGIGQAIGEEAVYDTESGQLLTGSFMDYRMPRAGDVPFFDIQFHEDQPSTTNPLGVKGCGEAGTVGALAAVVNAALDAFSDLGTRHVDMPLTPQKLWRIIHERDTS